MRSCKRSALFFIRQISANYSKFRLGFILRILKADEVGFNLESDLIAANRKNRLSLEKEYVLFHARILLYQGNQIEALTVLQSIEEDYQSTAFVIENILRLSIVHKRPISQRLIANAEKIDTLQSGSFLSYYHAEKNNAKLAMNTVTKALLRAQPEDAITGSRRLGAMQGGLSCLHYMRGAKSLRKS